MKSKPQSLQAQLASDALRRFYPQVGIDRLAVYLCETNPKVFESHSSARDYLRWYAGKRKTRGGRKSLNIVEPNYALMPKPHHVPREDFILPIGRYGFLVDVHIPFHELKPIEVALQWYRDKKVDGLILSDFQDCSAISYWPVTGKRDFPAEVEATIDFLDMLRANFPKTKIYWQRGNHEDRLEQYYRAFAPQLAGLPTSDLETTLCLAKRNITILARKQKIQIHKLAILHGHELKITSCPVSPSRSALLKCKACVVIAHFHQASMTPNDTIEGDNITAWSQGCLCDLSPDYNPFGNNWGWGASVLDYDGHDWEFDNRRILKRTGRLVT